MYRFFATVHSRPADAAAGPTVELGNLELETLQIAPAALAASRFACDFETAVGRLAQLPQMFCEPDGSFVWTSPAGATRWQVDGNLYDREGRLSFVDLQGECPREAFDRLLEALGWPDAPLVFVLRREAVVLDEASFRRAAEVPAGGR